MLPVQDTVEYLHDPASAAKQAPDDTLKRKLDLAEPQDEGHGQDLRRIGRLLAQIPESQAEVIRLRIYGNNSFAEIAGILAVPLPTVKSRFIYGLEKIRRGMKRG